MNLLGFSDGGRILCFVIHYHVKLVFSFVVLGVCLQVDLDHNVNLWSSRNTYLKLFLQKL